MLIKNAYYVGSVVNVRDCPPPDRPEYAFIGRSNVGKSSLINLLTGRKALAKVSHTPGKTQTINHFLINDAWYLVDLPGYGYARISKTMRQKWKRFIQSYLLKRENLQCVFVLVDSRIPPQERDLAFMNWLGEIRVPFVIVFTKTDDRKYQPENIEVFNKKMLESWTALPQQFLTSSKKKLGRTELLQFIETINEQFVVPCD